LANIQLHKVPYLFRALSIILIGLFSSLSAQPIALKARRMKSIQIDGHSAQLLKGNVQFEQQGSTVFCDEAEYDPKTESLKGIGNVKIINNSGSVVTGNYLFYDNKTHIARVEGKVELRDKSMKLSTPWLQYNTQTKLGWYGSGGEIIDNETYLKSLTGSFNPNTHTLYFRRKVILQTPDYVIQTDTLQYNSESKSARFFTYTQINTEEQQIVFNKGEYNTESKKGYFYDQVGIFSKQKFLLCDTAWVNEAKKSGVASGKIWYMDSSNRWQLWGDRALYNQGTGTTKIFNNAIALQTENKDSLWLKGDTLVNIKDTIKKIQTTQALLNVKLLQKSTAATAQIMKFSSVDSTLRLRIQPVLWDSISRFSGDSINMVWKNNQLKEGALFPKAFIAIQDEPDAFSQIQGDSIHYFLNEKQRMKSAFVYRNGKSIYNIKDADTLHSVFTVDCKDMKFLFKEGRVNTVHFYHEPQGNLYPKAQFDVTKKQLDRFKWDIENKPKRADFNLPNAVVMRKIQYNSVPDISPKTKKKKKWYLFFAK